MSHLHFHLNSYSHCESRWAAWWEFHRFSETPG